MIFQPTSRCLLPCALSSLPGYLGRSLRINSLFLSSLCLAAPDLPVCCAGCRSRAHPEPGESSGGLDVWASERAFVPRVLCSPMARQSSGSPGQRGGSSGSLGEHSQRDFQGCFVS